MAPVSLGSEDTSGREEPQTRRSVSHGFPECQTIAALERARSVKFSTKRSRAKDAVPVSEVALEAANLCIVECAKSMKFVQLKILFSRRFPY